MEEMHLPARSAGRILGCIFQEMVGKAGTRKILFGGGFGILQNKFNFWRRIPQLEMLGFSSPAGGIAKQKSFTRTLG